MDTQEWIELGTKKLKERFGVARLSAKLCENGLSWIRHVKIKTIDTAMKIVESLIVKA